MKLIHCFNHKRWLAVLSLVVGITLGAYAESVEIDGLYYALNSTDRTATLTCQPTSTDNYSSLPADVVIPASVTYNGVSFAVTKIADSAFANCTSMVSVSIPGTVTQIGTACQYYGELPFYGCTSLKSVRFEDGTGTLSLGSYYSSSDYDNYIGKGLFYSCPLEEVYIGRNLSYDELGSKKFSESPDRYGYSAFYNQPKLAKVTIGESCTEIPDYLFYGNTSITILTFPKVRAIGNSAFSGCSKLTTINLGNDLETVGNNAFYRCSNITKLTFPDATTSIGDNAFSDCTSVTEVTVGSGLKSIGSSAFYNCNSFTALILPDTFTTMGKSAFENCKKLTVAKLGESLTAVPAKAFKNCTALSEMVVPATAVSIGDQAFCNDSGLATITLNEGLRTIGHQVFWNNSGILRFTIPGTVTSMGSNCFYGCTNVAYLIFSEGEETLTIYNTDGRSSKIDALTYNKSAYYDYFYDCPIRFLTLGRNMKYSYSDSKSMYDVNGTSLESVTRASAPFVNCKTLVSVTIGSNVTFLYHHLLNGCENVKKITLPNGLQQVYSYCFANMPNLTSLLFPEPLVLLDKAACRHDIGLTEVIFKDDPAANLSFTIGDYALADCQNISSLSFPAKTISIGNYCFDNAKALKTVEFVDSKNEISLGYGATADGIKAISDSGMPLFGNSNLESLYIGRNLSYSAYSNDGYSPFYMQSYLTDVRFSQAGTVTYCHAYLLYKVNNCAKLLLPESLQSIGTRTFADMSTLGSIVIPNKVTKVGTYAFYNDVALKSAKLSTSCPWLKEGVFSGCVSLESITIPPVVTKMDTKLFANCTSLASATFEGATDLIEMAYGASRAEYGMFTDCPLETLNLNRWLSYDTGGPTHSPFYGIEELKNLNIGENVGVIDKYMFSYCTGLEDVYLPDNIESVGLWGFRGCSSLKNVRFSENLSQVSDYGFSECTSLDNVVFPASMTSIADNSFSNCTSLKKLDLGDKLMIIGPSAFKNDIALEGVEIPESLYGLGVEAFANCTSLPNVQIRGISSVGKQAFQGCTGLKWVSLSDKTTSLGENSFDGCTGINYIKSYAELPPEGLVNFPADVVANGTLFVPENSVDYYVYSPTWENWFSVRPLNENILVSSVSLDKTEVSFKATQTEQLTATVGADDAMDKSLLWRSSNEDVVTVDPTGLMTAVSVGEATVTAVAADGSGEKATCAVTVIPTLVESIAINSDVTSLKKGRTLALAAEVLPATATNADVAWSSSDISIASVNADGVVTALLPGNVDIIATAKDGSGVSKTFVLAIIPPTKGDSNDNDAVTITDAVNTANYAVGNEVENFCFEAADVNEDTRVTLADASATITVVLEQDVMPAAVKVSALARAGELVPDYLIIDDYSVKAGETASVFVSLDNTLDYVALQADITVPEGMNLADVKIGGRAEAYHSLVMRRINDRTARVVLFDVNNSVFAANSDAILELVVKAGKAMTGDIEINNILASDAQAREFVLTSAGGHNTNTSGIVNAGSDIISIETIKGAVNVCNAEGSEIAIFAADGTTLVRFIAKSDFETCKVAPGIYIVAAGEKVVKVIVK